MTAFITFYSVTLADIVDKDINITASFDGAKIVIYGAIDTKLHKDSILIINVLGPSSHLKIRKKVLEDRTNGLDPNLGSVKQDNLEIQQINERLAQIKETTTDTGEPYYPVLNEKNTNLYQKYLMMANQEKSNIHFIGRLASYKYFNMDQAICNALDYFKNNF